MERIDIEFMKKEALRMRNWEELTRIQKIEKFQKLKLRKQ